MDDTTTTTVAGPAGRVIPVDDDAHLLEIEVAFLLGISVATLRSQRRMGRGPAYIQLNEKRIAYTRRLLREFNTAQTRQLTRESYDHEH
jgi:hypothetical protein